MLRRVTRIYANGDTVVIKSREARPWGRVALWYSSGPLSIETCRRIFRWHVRLSAEKEYTHQGDSSRRPDEELQVVATGKAPIEQSMSLSCCQRARSGSGSGVEAGMSGSRSASRSSGLRVC
eukprot:2620976-Pyramimonas_sp.AAC.2